MLRQIVETKQETIVPIITTAIETKKALLTSPVIKSAVEAKIGVVKTLAKSGPEIGKTVAGLVGAAVKATPGLIKAGLCNIVCPISGNEQCKKDHCASKEDEDNQVEVQPRSSKAAFEMPEE